MHYLDTAELFPIHCQAAKTLQKAARQRYTMKQNFYFLLKSGSEKIVYKLIDTGVSREIPKLSDYLL